MPEVTAEDFALGTGSGLPSDFEGTIAHAEFAFDPNYMQGQQPVLVLEIERADGEEMVRQLYSIGKGMVIEGAGESVYNENAGKGARVVFNQNSNIGLFLARLTKPKAEGGLELVELLTGRQTPPWHAALYVGLSFHWMRETIDRGADLKKGEVLLPDQYLGDGAKPAAKAKKAAKAAAPAAEVEEEEEGDEDAAPEYPAKLVKMAKDADTWKEFRDEAIGEFTDDLDLILADKTKCVQLYQELHAA
jgi:hypothetical protein